MILFLRGHIRGSFSNNQLYYLVKRLHADFDIKIYIHTWSIVQSNISWRDISLDATSVTREMIIHYFKDLAPIIEEIMIEDDKQIALIGPTEGFICKSKCPTVAWKNMWYGKHCMLDHIYHVEKELGTDLQTMPVLNMRFDVQTNFASLQYHNISPFLIECRNIHGPITRNKFICNHFKQGIDNLYFGSIQTMYDLAKHFHLHLDTIVKNYPNVISQEELVFLENNRLYGSEASKKTTTKIQEK